MNYIGAEHVDVARALRYLEGYPEKSLDSEGREREVSSV